MLAAATLFAVMGAFVKIAAADLPASQLVLWRNLVAALIMLIPALRDRSRWRVRGWPALLARSGFGVVAMFCYFQAISRLPLGDAVLLVYASPIFVALGSPWALGEPARPRIWIGLVLGFAGVALVADPRFSPDVVGAAFGLAAAVLSAAAYISLRFATRTDRNSTIVLWFSVLCVILSAPALWPQPVLPASASGWWPVVAVGLAAVGAQLMMTRAYAVGEAARIALFSYATPVLAYLLGWAVLGEVVHTRGLIGTALVATAAWIARRED